MFRNSVAYFGRIHPLGQTRPLLIIVGARQIEQVAGAATGLDSEQTIVHP